MFRTRNIFILFSLLTLASCQQIVEQPLVIIRCSDAPIARASATAFVLADKAYIVGGRSGTDWAYADDIWRYDSQNDSWQKIGQLPFIGRVNMVCITVDNTAYMGGGFNGIYKNDSSYLRDWWKFDGTQWTRLPDLPTQQTDGMLAFTDDNGKIVIGCGYKDYPSPTLFAFDIKTEQWSDEMVPDYSNFSPTFGHIHSQCNNRIFAGLGTYDKNSNQWAEYDFGNNIWHARTPIPCKGGCFFSATTLNDHIIAAGGRAFGGSLTDGEIYDNIWLYDIQANSWVLGGHLPQPCENMIGFSIGNAAYFGLGEDANGNRLNQLFKIQL